MPLDEIKDLFKLMAQVDSCDGNITSVTTEEMGRLDEKAQANLNDLNEMERVEVYEY